VAQKFHFAILRIEVTRASRGLSAIAELLVIMAALRSRCGHYIFVLFLSLFLSSSFSSPNLSGRRLDVYHTSTHGVAL